MLKVSILTIKPCVTNGTIFDRQQRHIPDKRKEAIVKSFVEDADVQELSPDVVAQCVSIRRSKKIKTPDAIIAATAIVHNFTLLTSDSDFNCIAGLKVIDPHAIARQTSE